jgi:ABC-2 type transport system permease protein
MILLMMGIMWPLETMHPMLNFFSRLIPYTYALQALRNVNLIGWGFFEVLPSILILVGFIIVQSLAATFVLRREIR